MTTKILLVCIFMIATGVKNYAASEIDDRPFGVAIGWQWVDLADQDFADTFGALNASHTRLNMTWQQIEPRPGKYEYETLDRFFAKMDGLDCDILMNLRCVSKWGTRDSRERFPGSPPKDIEQYLNCLRNLVHRYKDKTRYWQIGNEMEVNAFWAGSGDEFVSLLQAASTTIKQEDPNAVVVLGGFQGHKYEYPRTLAFARTLLKEGKGYFDILDVHLYEDIYTYKERLKWFRETMIEFGYEVPIWTTECGGPTPRMASDFDAYIKQSRDITLKGIDEEKMSQGDRADWWRRTVQELIRMTPQIQKEGSDYLKIFFDPKDPTLIEAIHSQEVITRTLMALDAGIQKVFWWNFLTNDKHPLFRKMGLIASPDFSSLDDQRPAYQVYVNNIRKFEGMQTLERMDQGDVVIFKVTKKNGSEMFVLWKRVDPDHFPAKPVTVKMKLPYTSARQMDIFGKIIPANLSMGTASLQVTENPIFIQEMTAP